MVRAKAGQLKEIETDAQPGGRMFVTVNGAMSKLGIGQVGDKNLPMKDVSLPARLFPYCTIAPEQFALILAAYDVRQAGPQTFNVVYSNAVAPSGLIQGKLTITPAGTKPGRSAAKRSRSSATTSASRLLSEIWIWGFSPTATSMSSC